MSNCSRCKHIKKITGNKKARCLKHGMSVLVDKFMRITDRDRIKAIRFEMRMK